MLYLFSTISNKFLEYFLVNKEASNQSPFIYIINLIITFFMSYLLGYIYIKYGRSIANRRSFAQNFIILSMTTMVVISIVKSSLALSLGLVGALSIVRFRTPIKEPEELNYLFLAIAIGLGMGSNQSFLTIVGIIFILFAIYLRRKTSSVKNISSLTLLLSGVESDASEVILIMEKYCENINLKRLTEEKNIFDLMFNINIKNYKNLDLLRKELRSKIPSIKLSLYDNNIFSES